MIQMEIHIKERKIHGGILVIPTGEVNMETSPKLREVLLKLTKQKIDTIAVTLEEVDYVGSAGLATLIEAFQKTVAYGGTFKLIITKHKILDIFKIARLHTIFDIYANRADAAVIEEA